MKLEHFQPTDLDKLTQDFREQFEGNEHLPFTSREVFTFTSQGEVISIVGIQQFHKGVYIAWAFQSHSLTYVGKLYARTVKWLVDELMEKYNMRQMIIMTAANEPTDQRWVEFLGFERKFEIPGVLLDGSSIYGYIKERRHNG
jgi:hypothetical protein